MICGWVTVKKYRRASYPAIFGAVLHHRDCRMGLVRFFAGGVVLLTMVSAVAAQDVLRPADTTEVFIVSRSVDSIRADRERIGRFRGEADARFSIGRSRLAETEIQVELLKKEIEVLSAKIKTAKTEKREADKTVAEAEKKEFERRKNLVERRRDLRQAEVELAEAELVYSDAAVRALDFEHQLERKRFDFGDRGLLLELERKTLEAKLNQETSRKTLVDRRGRLVERQLGLLQAQVSFSKR